MLTVSSVIPKAFLIGRCSIDAQHMNKNYPHKLPADLIEAFERDGFVVTPGVFSANELAAYGEAVDREVARRTSGDARALADKTRYEQSFVQCMRLWETAPDILPFTCDPRLAGIATQLLGVEGVRLWQDQALYKEAGGAETTPHQDQTFWPIGFEPLVSAWIPPRRCHVSRWGDGGTYQGRIRLGDSKSSISPIRQNRTTF